MDHTNANSQLAAKAAALARQRKFEICRQMTQAFEEKQMLLRHCFSLPPPVPQANPKIPERQP